MINYLRYKITRRHRGHNCYDCGEFINIGCPAVIDTIYHHGYPKGHIRITKEKAYFHPRCYRDEQLMLGEREQFDKDLERS